MACWCSLRRTWRPNITSHLPPILGLEETLDVAMKRDRLRMTIAR
jgi:hypothetical protein